MKHNFKVTILLMLLFFSAQILGLFLLNMSIESTVMTEDGTIEVTYTEPITGRPDLQGQDSFAYILLMVLAGTILLLVLIRFKLFKIWKAWFFLAIWGSLTIALSVLMSEIYAAIIALVATYLKLYRPNALIHNFTEIFMYGGIAIMISPMFNVLWGALLLIAISIYDAIAVWKLKHMITLATAQADKKMFAGLLIPYARQKPQAAGKVTKQKEVTMETQSPASNLKISMPEGFEDEEVKSAILGGGDIAFPMLFAGSVMTFLIENGLTREMAYLKTLLIPLFAGIALFILLIKSEKDKFYPAMPFITAGCFVGFLVVILL